MKAQCSFNFLVPLMLLAGLVLASCSGHDAHDGHAHGHGPAAAHDDEPLGPRGGRLLEDGDFALEVVLSGRALGAELRLYPSRGGEPLPADRVNARAQLRRVSGLDGGTVEELTFSAHGDHLLADALVQRPYSFDVALTVSHEGREYRWRYEAPEDQTVIAADMIEAYGIATEVVGPGIIAERQLLHGRVRVNAEGVRAVAARFPGIVREVDVRLGEQVEAGRRLARIEASESLQVYAVSAPISGTLTRRAINPGELAGELPLFEIVDSRQVWAEFDVFPNARGRLALGQRVRVRAADGGAQGEGVLDYLSAIGAERSQALTARVVLDNAQGQWTPGQFISGHVLTAELEVPLSVPLSALQRMEGEDVVFVNEGEVYQAQPVRLGRRDHERVEVTAGLEPGARVVIAGAYLLKADIGKAAAEHEH